ncbi:MAG TPA: HD domain-containing protein [Candidatus Ruminococcus avistercoris]|nr:HD domain-containing protein [Candidatus Ruminococcus avistercoris]
MTETKRYVNKKHLLTYTLDDQVVHAMRVSNLAYAIGRELGLDEDTCQSLFDAGLLHDIGKEKLRSYVYEEAQNPLMVEEMKYVRMHATLGYEILRERGYPEFILQSVLHHHENMDGSGYPDNLRGEEIPYGARILRVCDVFAALISDRPYRKSFDKATAIELMIEEIKNFDIKVFLAFQRVIHRHDYQKMELIE